MNTYKVTIELEVAAESTSEAVDNAIVDIKELYRGGTLIPEVKLIELGDPEDE